MPYNNLISRTDAAAEIPEEVSRALVNRLPDDSAALQLFRRVPVSRGQTRFPVLSALPVAYFVTGDTGLKQTTEVNWANKFLNIEEIATIMPIPDAVVADMETNVWDEAEPYLREAVGRALDAAVFFGTNAPASWPTNVSAAAAAAGNTFTEASTAAQGGFFGDVDQAIALLEADGFDATGYVAARSARGKFRAARNVNGDGLDRDRINGSLSEVDGLPVVYPMRGLFPSGGAAGTNVRLFVGDWDEFVLGVRQDITLKILTEAVIQDNTGAIIYNLAQQDMTAVRLTFRVGWQVSNLINYDEPTEANRYPAARLMY
ncbi:MAG TPA: phage major capsid protein [Nonomuraea sp.]|nr:phage major capsid protein [Nonomuraea sp.]